MKQHHIRGKILFLFVSITLVLFIYFSPGILILVYDLGSDRPVRYNPNNPTEFFLIDKSIAEFGGRPRKMEYFVVANAPNDRARILELVTDFNQRTITADMAIAYTINRVFYRETRNLTRNFQRGEPYPTGWQPFLSNEEGGFRQSLLNHRDALFVATTYFRAENGSSTSARYWIRYGRAQRRTWEEKKQIDDIHAYFAGQNDN